MSNVKNYIHDYQLASIISAQNLAISSATAANFTLSPLYIYVDNVSLEAISGAVDGLNIALLDAASFRWPQNVPDSVFYAELNNHFSEQAIVITGDSGSDIMRATTEYQHSLSTIILAVSGKQEQGFATSNFFRLKGFREYWSIPIRYRKIRISRDRRDLVVSATDIRGKNTKERNIRKSIWPLTLPI